MHTGRGLFGSQLGVAAALTSLLVAQQTVTHVGVDGGEEEEERVRLRTDEQARGMKEYREEEREEEMYWRRSRAEWLRTARMWTDYGGPSSPRAVVRIEMTV